EELARPVVLARLGVGPRHRDRLANGSPALRGDDDHPGARRAFEHGPPLLRGEIGLRGHVSLLSPVERSPYGAWHGHGRALARRSTRVHPAGPGAAAELGARRSLRRRHHARLGHTRGAVAEAIRTVLEDSSDRDGAAGVARTIAEAGAGAVAVPGRPVGCD